MLKKPTPSSGLRPPSPTENSGGKADSMPSTRARRVGEGARRAGEGGNLMKKAAIFFLVPAILLFLSVHVSFAYEREIKNLSAAMVEKIAKAGKKTVAVVDFTDLRGNVTELGRFLAEEFSVALAGAGEGFEVVDRTHLKTLLREHKLGASGLIDPSTAKRLGEIAGVQALITGTLTSFGESVRLAIKILDTGTAKVLYATSGDIAKTKAIEELLAKGIESEPETTSQPVGIADPPPPTTQPSQTSQSLPAAPLYSKKVGDLIVAVKRLTVPKNSICVIISLNNPTDKELKVALTQTGQRLTDEQGISYKFVCRDKDELHGYRTKYIGGQNKPDFGWAEYGEGINAKSETNLPIYFESADADQPGQEFSINFCYVIYDLQTKKETPFSVFFRDIKPQKPK